METARAVREGLADPPRPPRRWSYSRLELYARCPLAYRFRYIDREPGKPSAAATRGKQVHEFCEAYARHCHAVERATDYDAGRELLAGYDDPEVRKIGEAFIESTVFDWALIVADGNFVERSFAVPLPHNLGLFRGRVDLVQWNEYEGALVVTDYKSGWSWEKPDECPAQLQSYAWAMMQQFPSANQVRAIYRYLGSGHTYDWTLYDPRPDWACAVVRRVLADDAFEPTPSAQACAYCGYGHLCPLVRADPVTCITDVAAAEECLRQITATEARLDELRKALNAWIKQHGGEVVAGGRRAWQAPPVWHVRGEEYTLRNGAVGRREMEAALLAAGLAAEDVARLWRPEEFDPKAAGRLVKSLRVEEDPFGHEETDPRLDALLQWIAPRPWDGKTRFRIDDVPDAEPPEEEA